MEMGMRGTGELTFELMQRMQAEFGDFRRDLAAIEMSLSSLEQHQAAMTVSIAGIKTGLGRIRGNISAIKHQLDLAEA